MYASAGQIKTSQTELLVRSEADGQRPYAASIANRHEAHALIKEWPMEPDVVTQAYFAVADDLLRGSPPIECTASHLRAKFPLVQPRLFEQPIPESAQPWQAGSRGPINNIVG